ncbi:ParA family protein [Kitasatospora sp. NPDC058048]|uniref:ParA family protein n=1 Tax=Kitasatospora sp. NPDC058048 TaxID=3346313 RepID=UPI0036DC4977
MNHQELREWIALPRPEEGPFIVSVWGGKGGITKSTLAFLLAYELGKIAPTLLINADAKQTDGGVTEMTANLRVPATFELTESDDPAELHAVRRLTQFRYVITDNQPFRDREKLKAAAKADLVVVPMPPRRSDMKSVLRSIRDVLQPERAPYRIILSMIEHSAKGKAKTMKDTLNTLSMPVYDGWIRKYTAHEMLSGLPVTLSEEDNADKAAEDVYMFIDATLAHLGEPYKAVRKEVTA